MPPPRSSSLKRRRVKKEKENANYTKRERKAGWSRAEKALVAAKTWSASASPARTEKDALQGIPRSLPSSTCTALSSPFPSQPIPRKEKNDIFPKGKKFM